MADPNTSENADRPIRRRRCQAAGAKRANPKAATGLDKQIGHRLRKLREEKDRTLVSLGRELGISGTQLGKYELGVDRIPASRLFDAAVFLGKGYDYFMGKSAPPGLSEPEQSVLDPKYCEDTEELVAAFAQIGSPELRRLAIDLVTGIAKPKAKIRKPRA